MEFTLCKVGIELVATKNKLETPGDLRGYNH